MALETPFWLHGSFRVSWFPNRSSHLTRLRAFCLARYAHLPTKLNSEYKAEQDAMRHEKFEANINPTPDGFQNFSNRSADTTCHDVSADLSVGFQLLVEVELYLPQSFM